MQYKYIDYKRNNFKNYFLCPTSDWVNQDKGFTLVELLVGIALLAIIVSLGLFLSFDFYRNFSVSSQANTIVSILQKARSQSLNNINQARHGVHFEDSSGLKYILFECPAGIPCASYNLSYSGFEVKPAYGISLANSLPLDVIFDQLSGCLSSTVNDCSQSQITITVNGGVNPYNININSEGRIDW
ncbi:MAG: prepilin-type N-terminal cleavage/methylation domain-containing protein [Patescibacteria group bacterium]